MNSEVSTRNPENSPGPKPERAIYGFFILSSAIIAFILYIMIAYLPDSVLNAFGWDYLPAKHWMIIGPYLIWTCALMVYPVCWFLDTSVVNSLDAVNSIIDEHSLDKNVEKKSDQDPSSIDPVYDIPLSEICQHLFLNKKLN